MSIVGPALAPFPRWPIFAGGLEAGRNYAIGGLLILFALLLAYDIATRRRPHPASWIGMIAILVPSRDLVQASGGGGLQITGVIHGRIIGPGQRLDDGQRIPQFQLGCLELPQRGQCGTHLTQCKRCVETRLGVLGIRVEQRPQSVRSLRLL
jgi:hypothetical protein